MSSLQWETVEELDQKLAYRVKVIRKRRSISQQKLALKMCIRDRDCIFHKDFITDEDKKKYISFLSSLLKDKAYVLLSYMTGILPIAKYSSGSELNMFAEYKMCIRDRWKYMRQRNILLTLQVKAMVQKIVKKAKSGLSNILHGN